MTARRKGTGRIFARGGMWYFRFRDNGKEITRTTGIEVGDDPATSKASAEEWVKNTDEVKLFAIKDREMRLVVIKHLSQTTEEELKDRMSEVKKGESLSRLTDLFKNSPRRIDCSQDQLETYLRYCIELISFVGEDRHITDIGDVEAESYARHLASKGFTNNTYNKHLNGLTVVWNAISPSLGIKTNPWKSLPRKKLDGKRREDFTDEEISKILNTAEGDLKTLILIGLYTGMRLSDCACLRVEDVKDNTVKVTTGKTGAKVAIPLHENLKAALKTATPEDGYFLPDYAERCLNGRNSSISRLVNRVLEKCGIETSYGGKSDESENDKTAGKRRPLRGFHSLRHTFVSRCVSAGIPLHLVQALTGHASAKMTEHYTHLKDKDFLESFGKLK